MLQKIKTSIVALVVFLTTNALAGESPIKINVERAYNQAYHYYYPKIIITSLKDNLVVNQVLVNKGNCQFPEFDLGIENNTIATIKVVPRKLKYGESMEIRLQKCNILKIDVDTNYGEWGIEY